MRIYVNTKLKDASEPNMIFEGPEQCVLVNLYYFFEEASLNGINLKPDKRYIFLYWTLKILIEKLRKQALLLDNELIF